MSKVQKKRVKISVAMGGKAAGSQFALDFCNGVPVDSYWRRRWMEEEAAREKSERHGKDHTPSIELLTNPKPQKQSQVNDDAK